MISSPVASATSGRLPVWVQALALALVPAVIVGFGRFAYGLILPAMKEDLGLNYAQLGSLNTANALGYFVGALVSVPLARRFPERVLIFWGVLFSILALFVTGLVRSFELLFVLRAAVGFTAAMPNIAATGLAARLGDSPRQNALFLGIAIAGPGLGVAFTGLTLPFLLHGEASLWPRAWEFLAGAGAGAFGLILWGTRAPQSSVARPTLGAQPFNFGPLVPAFGAYFLFGLGYIAYMTFLVAYVRSLGASPLVVALAFTVLGAAMFGAPWVWRARLSRERGGTTLFWMGLIGGISALLPLLSTALPVLIISATGFGVTSMAIYTAVTLLLRLHAPPATWTVGVAYATTVFALGQSIGPFGAGLAADHFGPRASLVWSGLILIAAGLVALRQKLAPAMPANPC